MASASAATATTDTASASRMVPTGPSSSSASPRGDSTNANGTRNAGSVYRQVSIMVRNGLPPVMAAAATADSAVGGLTSERTA